MGGDTGKLAADDADRLAAGRELPAHQLLDGEGVGDVVGEGCEVIESVCVGDELVVLHVLGNLLVAAVQVANLRLCLHDQLSVEIEHDAEHSVGRGVGGAEVQGHRLPQKLAGGEVCPLFLDGLLGTARGVRGLENGARAHGR